MIKRLFIIVASILFVFIVIPSVAFMAYAAWANGVDEEEVAKLTVAASKFTPDPSWKLKEENTIPNRSCFEHQCPVVFRAWNVSGALDKNTAKKTLVVDGTSLTLSESCFVDQFASCSADGVINGYKYSFYHDGIEASVSVTKSYYSR